MIDGFKGVLGNPWIGVLLTKGLYMYICIIFKIPKPSTLNNPNP